MLTRSNAQAYAVLAALYLHIDEDKLPKLNIESYVNGREHGFCITNWDNKNRVAFSENRNSDDIVVYFGEYGNFCMQGNVPEDETYRNKRLFPFLAIEKAAEFIKDHLEGK